jgi:flagellar basal body rod protein FlgF
MKNQEVNVAPQSTSGHFVKEAINVVALDDVKETFKVVGRSKLTTKNHTDLIQEKDCLITTQQVYNPFSKMFERSKD